MMARKDWGTRSYENAAGAVLAIIVGAALAVGMTASVLMSYCCRGDAAPGPPIIVDRVEDFVDPRGPDRGPTSLEWDVIRAYKPIESMTAHDPAVQVVDRSLARLQAYAERHPNNPYIQELYLKGLRVAAYWAAEGGAVARVAALRTRFDAYAFRFVDYDGVTLEMERFDAQATRS